MLLIRVAVAASPRDPPGDPPPQHPLSPTEHPHLLAALSHDLGEQSKSPREQGGTRCQQIISARGDPTSETGRGLPAWAAQLRTTWGGALSPRASAAAGTQMNPERLRNSPKVTEVKWQSRDLRSGRLLLGPELPASALRASLKVWGSSRHGTWRAAPVACGGTRGRRREGRAQGLIPAVLRSPMKVLERDPACSDKCFDEMAPEEIWSTRRSRQSRRLLGKRGQRPGRQKR